ncbi:ParA family protein [Leptospira noguchii]|uniref:ParA family protein n=1 Tax=Leptospira noguchii TaxID=28182 RepID=UPI00055FDD30|nr:AAA family ATPase [Leptospira noguchii]
MVIIAIVNQKGGVGKTTETSIFAKSLSDSGKRVLIVDTDPQGGISSLHLPRLDDAEDRRGLFDILMGDNPILHDNIHPSHHTKLNGVLHIIPADHKLDKIFVSIEPFALREIFKNFGKNEYDYVIIDTPPTVQGTTRAAIILADRIIVPCETTPQSLGPTKYTVESILSLDKKPEIIYIGWKKPEGDGFQARYAKLFEQNFAKYFIGTLPRNITSSAFASEDKKVTSPLKNGLIYNVLELLEKKK